jgi:intracellular sulfur oxidation DsrE/DsrF family protein
MTKYLLIETRDPFESSDVSFCHDLARRLVAEGNQVILYLVQNGVLPARSGARASALSELAQAGIEVLADDFSLRERGIPVSRLQVGVKAAPLDVVIDGMAEGSKVIWH